MSAATSIDAARAAPWFATPAALLSAFLAIGACSERPRDESSVRARPSARSIAPTGHGDAFVAGTFNIRYDNAGDGANRWSRRRELVVGILREGDLWGLQEALPTQVAELAGALPEFGVLSRTRERDPAQGEACPILYRRDRFEPDPDDHGTFWLGPTPDEPGSRGWDAALPRIATWSRLVDREGRGLYLFNAHFDHRGEEARRESARVLLDRIAARRRADPVIVTGDLNCGPGSPALGAILASREPVLVDAWRAANPSAPEQATFNGWADECRGARIDWLFAERTPSLAIEACDIDLRRPSGRWPSDHAPVVARLRRR